MRAILLTVVVCWLGVAGPAGALPDQVHLVPAFDFENGARLEGMKVGFPTCGTLSPDRSNAVLVTHGTSQDRNVYRPFIGAGKAFDTDKYFVITVDGIGGGLSSQPSDGLGPKFPRYTVRAQHDLVTKRFGIGELHAVGGPSMGAFQALEWGITFPDAVGKLLLVVPGARSDRHVHAIFDEVDAAIRLDPKFKDGGYGENPAEGIVLAGMIYFPWLYSDEHLNTIGDDAWRASTRAVGEAWAKAWDANALLLRYDASRNFDPSVPFGGDLAKALGRVEARMLVMPSATDRTLPAYLAAELRRGVRGAKYVEIPSALGHLACCPATEQTAEYAFIARQIADFLSEP